jgi:ribosome-binding protein aMBF1 (putative translation factor)
MTQTTSTYQVVGITDEQDTCELCGRQNLKSVIVLDADGEFVFYGSECGAKMTGKPVRDINREAKSAQKAADLKAENERRAAREAEYNAKILAAGFDLSPEGRMAYFKARAA